MHLQLEENSQKKIFSFNYNERDIKKSARNVFISHCLMWSYNFIIRNYYEIKMRKIKKFKYDEYLNSQTLNNQTSSIRHTFIA